MQFLAAGKLNSSAYIHMHVGLQSPTGKPVCAAENWPQTHITLIDVPTVQERIFASRGYHLR